MGAEINNENNENNANEANETNEKTVMQRAEDVLMANEYSVNLNGTDYTRTVPSKEFYVHQWNWDSATHAMGLLHINEKRAFSELTALCSGQWENGLIAQITFNPNETKYFPGPEFWGTEAFATGEIQTSGISQPPLLGYALAYCFENATDEAAARQAAEALAPKVAKYHNYLKKFRDPENCGLLTMVHPWESGLDNSPRWDAALERIRLEDIPQEVIDMVNTHRSDDKLSAQAAKFRPGLEEYYRYMHLVNLYKSWNWDYTKIVKDSPFAIKDVLFSALYAASNSALARVMNAIGRDDLATQHDNDAEQTCAAIEKLYSAQMGGYADLDVSGTKPAPIIEDTLACFAPLFCESVTDENRINAMVKRLNDTNAYATANPLPSTPLNSKKFELTRYWRGPTWPILNLFIADGLENYLHNPDAKTLHANLVNSTLSTIEHCGFFEYYDPMFNQAKPGHEDDVASLGFGQFSWSAAIYSYFHAKKERLGI